MRSDRQSENSTNSGGLFSVQQQPQAGRVVYVRRAAATAWMTLVRLVHPDVGLHAEEPLVAIRARKLAP